MNGVKLARNWSKARVLECLANKETSEIIRFLGERYDERFFSPINCLRKAPGNTNGYGFAIMALCCLLVETIQCYREGLPCSNGTELNELADLPLNSTAPSDYKLVKPLQASSKSAFIGFFSNSTHQKCFPKVDGKEFYLKIRCGLLHQAQTNGTWLLMKTGTFWDSSKKMINRDEFAQRLQECFSGYLKELNEHAWDENIWKSARKKIWWLAQLS